MATSSPHTPKLIKINEIARVVLKNCNLLPARLSRQLGRVRDARGFVTIDDFPPEDKELATHFDFSIPSENQLSMNLSGASDPSSPAIEDQPGMDQPLMDQRIGKEEEGLPLSYGPDCKLPNVVDAVYMREEDEYEDWQLDRPVPLPQEPARFMRGMRNARQQPARRQEPVRAAQLPVIPLPKGLCFDGSSRWESFQHRFDHFLRLNRIDDFYRQLDYLHLALQGEASDYLYDQQRIHDLAYIGAAYQLLHSRFGQQMLESEAINLFIQAYQEEQESVLAYADRLWRLAFKAYPQDDRRTRERHVVSRFINGLWDTEAGQFISWYNCETMQQAIQKHRLYANSMVIRNRPKPRKASVPQHSVRFREPAAHAVQYEDEYDDEYEVQALTRQNSNQFQSQRSNRFQPEVRERDPILLELIRDRKEMREELREDRKEVRQLLGTIVDLQRQMMEKLTVRARSRSPSPNCCFKCGGQGHFRDSCPLNSPAKAPKDTGSIDARH